MNRDELKEMMMDLGFHSRCGVPVQHILFDIDDDDDDDDDADEYKEDYKDITRIMKMIWLMIKNED